MLSKRDRFFRSAEQLGCLACPSCGAALDPGERCDCRDIKKSQAPKKKRKKNAAPVLQHQDGKVESVLSSQNSTAILHNHMEDCQV